MDHDELLAKLLSGEMNAPQIGLKSAKSNKQSKREKKQERKEEKKAEKKAEKEAENALPDPKKEMKANLRKALKGKLVGPEITIKSGKVPKTQRQRSGRRQAWAIENGYMHGK